MAIVIIDFEISVYTPNSQHIKFELPYDPVNAQLVNGYSPIKSVAFEQLSIELIKSTRFKKRLTYILIQKMTHLDELIFFQPF
jgi:hypothetical protein